MHLSVDRKRKEKKISMHYYETGESWGRYLQLPVATSTSSSTVIERLAGENAVVIFSVSSCCMCHAIKRLFCGMGVNPTVYELDQQPLGKEMEKALMRLLDQQPPVVFVGGKLVGAMDTVMASHISGTLVPLLKEADCKIFVRTQGIHGVDAEIGLFRFDRELIRSSCESRHVACRRCALYQASSAGVASLAQLIPSTEASELNLVRSSCEWRKSCCDRHRSRQH
ncbi:hypothetical protein L1987_73028 [Smallanthus sonchifolius]|uniref:Uncharacterized protein n=1 Tax=Smallanthus sonchifolius TaxID=185202 RepID=A0ACB9AWV6_9ASTR|nr:hypothetical protein L1987_73028 [Smallanthus sonchifolius]